MSVHPKFNPELSSCGNCAAFCGSANDHGEWIGSCHRFAPRPAATIGHFPEGGTRTRVTEPQGIIWPQIKDEPWCLDWLPRHGCVSVADESRWGEYYATLKLRSRNGLARAYVKSFARLDEITDFDLLQVRHIGELTVADIREKRKAFPGGGTK